MRELGIKTGRISKFYLFTLALFISGTVTFAQSITADFSYTQSCETFNFKDKSTSTGGGISAWFWEFGDGFTSDLSDPSHVYSAPAGYLVTLTVTHEDPTITDSYSEMVEYFYPEAGFTFTNICESFNFQNTSTPAGELDSAYWYFGEGDTLKLYDQPFSAGYQYTFEGEYMVFLKVFVKGCADTISDTLSFFIPQADFIYSNICNEFQFTNQSTVTTGILTYQWDFGDSNTSTDENPAHTYTSAGDFDVSLIVTHESGCKDTLIQNVSFYQPDPQFSYTGSCGLFEFFDQSTAPAGLMTAWQWNFGDGAGASALQNPVYNYTTPGNYPVKLIVTHESGCIDSITQIISFEYPVADFTYTNDCESFNFINNSIPVNEIDSVHWYFGEGDTLRLFISPFNATYSFTTEGEYVVFLKVFHESGCWNMISDTVSFYHPQAEFAFTNVCGDFQFNNESTVVTGVLSYLWDFDDGFTSTDENPDHVYSATGDYEVSLIVTHESGCESSISHLVSFYEPVALFDHDPPCFGNQTCFYDQSIPNAASITAWYWDFGTGITSGVPNPCYIYATPGEYIVTLSVLNSDGCVSNPYTDTLNVDLEPVADFISEIGCLNDTSFFINQSDTSGIQVASWLWDFGDPGSGGNNTSALFEPHHIFTAEGPFDVTLTVENINGCTASVINTIVIDSIPFAAFTAPDTIAVGVEITISDYSVSHGIPILSRFWDFGDGTTALNPNPVIHTYSSGGSFEICLTVTNIEGCSDSACSIIVVTDTPHADFTYNTGTNLVTNFFDNSFTESTIIDWYWDFGDPLSVTDTSTNIPNPAYTYPYAGYFPVYLKIFDSHSGIHDTTKIIYVGTAVVADFIYSDVCLGDTAELVDQSYTILTAEFDSWSWDFGDGTDTTYYEQAPIIEHFYPYPGVYNISLTVSGNVNGALSLDTVNKDFYVFSPPVARIDSVNMIACLGQQIHFVDSSYTIDSDSITSWLWDFGDGVYSTLKNPYHQYANVQDYMVTLTVNTIHSCSDVDTVGAKITIAPDINFSVKNPCVNSEAVFIHTDSDIEITEWFWDLNDPYSSGPDTSILEEPTHVYTRVDQYTVTMFASSYGCSKTLAKTFVVKPIPYSDFSFISDYQDVQGRTKFENYSIYATNYLWDFGNGHTSGVEDPVEVYEKDSTYLVTLTSTNEYGCSDTSRYELEVFFRGLYFPTAFSPNNPNPEVSKFMPKGVNLSSYEVQVFDMRGNVLWVSDALDDEGSPVESWDGYYNGILMPEGVYVWKAKGMFRDGTVWAGLEFQSYIPQTHGTVTLIR